MASSSSRKRPASSSFDESPSKRSRRSDTNPTTLSELPAPLVLLDVPRLQHIWDNMAHGTLFELARLAILHDIDLGSPMMTEKRLEPLIGTNLATVNDIWDVLGVNPSRILCPLAAEMLDWEADKHILADGSTLESSDEVDPSKARSGKVAFTASLSLASIKHQGSTPSVKPPITLQMPKIGPSCLFTRVFGSHRFLRVKIVDRIKLDDRDRQALYEMALRPILILGRVYRPLVEKNDTVWYFLEGQDRLGKYAERLRGARRGEYGLGRFIPSPSSLINWWTPFSFNQEQPICKLVTRLHLGVSDTSPGPLVGQIYVKADIERNGYVFTDGSSEASGPLLRRFRVKCPPSRHEACAYQIRISAAKGVVQLADTTDTALPLEWMSMTPSMIKAKHGKLPLHRNGPTLLNSFQILDAAHLVACIVQDASWRYPAQLSKQLIPILHHQGVPMEMLMAFLEKDITDTMRSLQIQPPPKVGQSQGDILAFAKAVQDHGNLIHRTLLEDPYGRAPRRKLKSIESEEPWTLEDILPNKEDDSVEYSYANSVMYEVQQLYLAIIVGFNISSSNYLLECWRRLVKRAVKKSIIDFRIAFKDSAYCMLVPDFTGQLPEGYISFTPPETVFDNDHAIVNFTEGEVLIGRHPALLPTDIQKVRLANIDCLKHKRGLIICSTQGFRPLADLLSGGGETVHIEEYALIPETDYDGGKLENRTKKLPIAFLDEAIIIWDSGIVNAFWNADPKLSLKPAEVDASFVKDLRTIGDLCQRTEHMDDGRYEATIAENLLGSIQVPSLHGTYNSLYLKAIDKYGFDSLDARILAHKSNMLLDAAKTSMRLLDKVKADDGRKYGVLPKPRWKVENDNYKKFKVNEDNGPRSSAKNNPLDILLERGTEFIKTEHRKIYGSSDKFQLDQTQHKKLLAPWKKAQEWARGNPDRERELEVIKNVVNDSRQEFGKISSRENEYRTYQANLFELARQFATKPMQSEVPQLMGISDDGVQKAKASFAYTRDCEHNRGGNPGGFPWKVSSLILLSILAEGTSVKISFPHLARLTPHSSFVSNL